MKNIIQTHNNQSVTTSEVVAKQLGFSHKTLLDNIKKSNYGQDYLIFKSDPDEHYLITSTGSIVLIMELGGENKQELISAFTDAFRAYEERELKNQQQAIYDHEKRLVSLEINNPIQSGHYTIVGYANVIKIKVNKKDAAKLGKRASKLCKELGVNPNKIPDIKYGMVKAYPENILQEVFDEFIKEN